jgi:hypothetical protein
MTFGVRCTTVNLRDAACRKAQARRKTALYGWAGATAALQVL